MHGRERGHVKNRGVVALLSIIHRKKNVIISYTIKKPPVPGLIPKRAVF
jgi:hypothetical protein